MLNKNILGVKSARLIISNRIGYSIFLQVCMIGFVTWPMATFIILVQKGGQVTPWTHK